MNDKIEAQRQPAEAYPPGDAMIKELYEQLAALQKENAKLQARIDAAVRWCEEDAIQLGADMYFVKPGDILKILTDKDSNGGAS